MTEPRFMEPMPPYFIIKIGKEEQRKKKEYLTKHILANPGTVFMQREVQFGEIVKIGEGAKGWMPMAEIGDYLLVHHFISGKVSDRGYNFYLIDEDSDFNYYAVNSYEVPGERPMAYAIARGEEIMPTPDYIFLECPKEETEDTANMTVSENGLIVPKEKKKTREEWTAIMKQNMARIQQLSHNLPKSTMDEILIRESPERKERYEYAMREIKNLEAINIKISKDINKKRYEPFVVAAINPDWAMAIEKMLGERIVPGDVVYMLNMACQYKLDFSGVEYIIAECKYFAISEKKIKEDIYDFEHRNAAISQRASKVRS